MKFNNFISDGFSRPGYIEGVKNLCEPMRFTYRPAIMDERNYVYEVNDPRIISKRMKETLAKKVLSWDLKDEVDKPVPVNTDTIGHLLPHLLTWLGDIVLGYKPSHTDPEWDAKTSAQQADDNLDAYLASTTVGESREANDVKN